MQRLLTFIKRPYAEKGVFIGTCDVVLKAMVLCLWAYVTVVLAQLFIGSLITDYNPLNKMWWFSYCFLMFFGTSWLAYIALFVRDYNEN